MDRMDRMTALHSRTARNDPERGDGRSGRHCPREPFPSVVRPLAREAGLSDGHRRVHPVHPAILSEPFPSFSFRRSHSVDRSR